MSYSDVFRNQQQTVNHNCLHTQEVEIFLKTNFIDILKVSETHFTDRSYFKIRDYDLIIANHPAKRAHGGPAVLIKPSVICELSDETRKTNLQAACVKIICNSNYISKCAIYFLPRYAVKLNASQELFGNLRHRFIYLFIIITVSWT